MFSQWCKNRKIFTNFYHRIEADRNKVWTVMKSDL